MLQTTTKVKDNGRTPGQNKKLHWLLNALKLDKENLRGLIYNISMGSTESTADLSKSEFDRLLNTLQKMHYDDPAQRMRRKIMSCCHELGWHLPGSEKIDYPRLNAWLMKYGYLHKPLNNYAENELPKLVTQFENMLQ